MARKVTKTSLRFFPFSHLEVMDMRTRWLAAFAAALLLSLGALSQPASAVMVLTTANVDVSWSDVSGSGTDPFSFTIGGDNTFQGSGSGSTNESISTGQFGSYSFQVSGFTDPLINWSFDAYGPTSATGTHYIVTFSMPVIGNPYQYAAKTAGVTVSDLPPPGAPIHPTSITGVSIKAELDGTPIAALTSTGDVTGVTNNTVVHSYGQASQLGSYSPSTMSVVLDFTLIDTDGDGHASFNGLFRIDKATPEPATIASAFTGLLLGGLVYARRLRRKAS